MAIEPSEVHIRGRRGEDGGGAAEGIVIITSNDGASAAEHFPNRAEVIAGVKVSLVAAKLSLSIETQGDRVGRVVSIPPSGHRQIRIQYLSRRNICLPVW